MMLATSHSLVLKAVVEHPTYTTEEYSDRLGYTFDYTRRRLNELRAMQLVDCLYSHSLEQGRVSGGEVGESMREPDISGSHGKVAAAFPPCDGGKL